jgi:hypothetical protein
MEEHEFKIENCTFEFECDAKWDEMAEVQGMEISRVRHCGRCKQSVFRVDSKDELLKNIFAKNCVAVDAQVLSQLYGYPDTDRWEMTLGKMKYEDEDLDFENRKGFFSRLKNVLFR